MGNEIEAINLAIDYAQQQVDWYSAHAFWKMIFFRTAGVVSIIATILITFLAASLTNPDSKLFGLEKKYLIAGLAAISAVSVSLSGFFGWQNAWESHRTAEFEIKAAIVQTQIDKITYAGTDKQSELKKLATELTRDVSNIVLRETDQFYRGIDNQKSEDTDKTPGS